MITNDDTISIAYDCHCIQLVMNLRIFALERESLNCQTLARLHKLSPQMCAGYSRC